MLSYRNITKLIKNVRFFHSTDDIYKRILNNQDRLYYHNMYCDFLKYRPSTLKYLPICMNSENSYKCAVSTDGNNLKYLSKTNINELSKLAVLQNGVALKYVPIKLCDLELCTMAVKKNGLALEFVPIKLITSELCHLAVKNNGLALRFVPKEFYSKKLFQTALNNNPWSLKYVPDAFITYDLCFDMVKKNVHTLCLVPYNFRTKEMCYYAVGVNAWVLFDVPKNLYSDELYRIVYNYHYKNTMF